MILEGTVNYSEFIVKKPTFYNYIKNVIVTSKYYIWLIDTWDDMDRVFQTAYMGLLLWWYSFCYPIILWKRIHHSPSDKINEFHTGKRAVNRSYLLSSGPCCHSVFAFTVKKNSNLATQERFVPSLAMCTAYARALKMKKIK